MQLNVAQKIFGITLVILVLMATVAVYSIRLTANISEELDVVANRHLPLSDTVARINVRILEQGVLLQRLLVLSGDMDLKSQVTETRAAHARLGAKTHLEFETAHKLITAEESLQPHIKKRLAVMDASLTSIENEYRKFDALGPKLVDARETGNMQLFDELLPALNENQDTVNARTADLRRHIEKFTDAAVVRADRNEKILLLTNSVLTVLAVLLGLGFSLIVTRMLVRAVRNLVTGTEAVEHGDLDTEVSITSKDEIGRLTGSFNNMVGELRMKERIKDTFGKYMDPRIVTNLLDHPEFAEPGGERRDMTVMFIDLKGFTSISEKLPADQLVHTINGFFGHMTEAISSNHGVVDKFMGDAVMAYWGPPFTGDHEHATLACRAAMSALEHLELFRAEVAAELGGKSDEIEIDLRIGISTGEMVVGTIGSTASRSFTVMGDPVNLGARLEGANKAYGTRVMISEQTLARTGNSINTRELDLIRVKGKAEPTRVYEVTGLADGVPLLPPPASENFQAGLIAYRAQDWLAAQTAFETCLRHRPEDQPSRVYLDRVSHLQKTPPPADWDGVWVFETK